MPRHNCSAALAITDPFPETGEAADLFISYARDDVDIATALYEFLTERGFKVWWDNRLRPGEVYRTKIHAALESASCVIVIWSSRSQASEWVLDEAENAKKRGVLVPAVIEPGSIPLGFGQRHYADLAGWDRASDDSETEKLLDQIRYLVERGSQERTTALRSGEARGRSTSRGSASNPSSIRGSPLGEKQRILSGLVGGAFGGVVAGLIIGLNYYLRYQGRDLQVSMLTPLETSGFALVFGAVMGGSIMFAIVYFRQLAAGRPGMLWGICRILGGPVGGLTAGIAAGVIAGQYFGFRYQYYAGDVLLLLSGLAGAAILVFGTVYFEPGRTGGKIFWSAASTLIIAAVVAGIGILVVLLLKLANLFPGGSMTEADMAVAGAITGGTIGLIMGSQVQWALYLIGTLAAPPK